ncbi:MAG TPA: ATP-binding protein, partial [Gammaproteobacteria bacterium]|nr:ATP-binding protein [Gammaproteobacteria bacterium]
CLAGEVLREEEDPFLRSDGTTQWVKWEVRPWRASDGNIGGILMATEDVTDRVLARQELQESRADLNRAQAVGQIGSWRLDLDRNVLTWSEENYRIFGMTQGTPLDYERFLDSVHADDRTYVDRKWKAALDGAPYDIEHRILVDGKVKWVREKAYLEHDSTGRLCGGFGITQDITGRKLAELALKEADRHKNEFLAMLAHEIRNPLAAIRNAADILSRAGPQNPTLGHAGGMIERQVRQLVRLVDDLLDVSRVSRGKIKLRREPHDLAQIIRQAIETTRPFIESRDHRLSVTLPGQPVRVYGDPARLTQVIGNLLNNAAKYTDSGGSLSLSVEHADPGSAGGNEVIIRVRDNGLGINADSLANLFNLFYQENRNLDRTGGGLGIGLSLVKSLVEMHGGQVEAHSAGTGKGSEFVVRLPCLADAVPAQESATAAGEKRVTGVRILLVEDNTDVAESMSLLLTLLGHEVSVAHDGPQAIGMALQERPDIVLLDIGLPVMDGYQVCRTLRDCGLTGTPIVGISGYDSEEVRATAATAGFDRYMTKPVSPQDIEDLLADLPDERQSSGKHSPR